VVVAKCYLARARWLAIAGIAAGSIVIVERPTGDVFSQEPSYRERATPKAALRAGNRAQSNESESSSAWLQAQDMSGSSAESEQAIELGLAWLAEHQLPTGGWSFDHRFGSCQGRCSNPGKALAKAVNGATGIALLSFIDHGNTHKIGPYRHNVAAGLQFLIARMGKDGSLWEPEATMYSHALGTLALCEELRIGGETPGRAGSREQGAGGGESIVAAVSKLPARRFPSGRRTPRPQSEQQPQDPLDRLEPLAASKAVAFALACQDSRRGGWRYDPRHPDSDISVTGWHVMALRSAAEIGIPIPALTVARVTAFLDSVQGNFGTEYGYQYSAVDATPTRSSIGLLCRVYTGWDRQQLQRGIEILAGVGPSENDMYYNYYGTLLLHHYGGPLWDDWNRKLRDYLIRTQSHRGHETGSWSFRANPSNTMGGRHFDTCMACLILETYYRSKPVYTVPQPPNNKPAGHPAGTADESPAKRNKTTIPTKKAVLSG
jgi:hypothetical protein